MLQTLVKTGIVNMPHDDSGNVVVPRWLVNVIAGACVTCTSVVIACGGGIINSHLQMSTNLAEIAGRNEAQNQLRVSEFSELKRRVEKNETAIESVRDIVRGIKQ